MRRTTFIAGLMTVLAASLAAQTPSFLTLGKYPVHPTRILARYADAGVAKSLAESAMKALDLQVARQYPLVPNLVMLELGGPTADALKSASLDTQSQALMDRIIALRESGAFSYVEPDYIVSADLTPNDAAFTDGRLWGLNNTGQKGGTRGADINVVPAWDLTTGSTNVVVAVIDTGIRYTHQDLVGQIWVNPKEIAGNGKDDDNNGFVDDVHGINAITMSGDPMDDNSHGTHCSGTIGAAANNGKPHVGVAWQVQLMGCKFLSAGGFGATSDAITCVNYAVANGAKILSNSWGGGGSSQALRDAIAAARTAGVLFVAAAGNSGSDNDAFPHYPSSYDLDNIVAVAALDRFDALANFSCFGLTSVDLGAPGVEIFSSTASSDSSYEYYDGTSMACPHVSGVAALILARYPNASLLELRERLLMTTHPVQDLQGRCTTGGRVDAFKALSVQPDGVLEVSVTPPDGTVLLEGSTEPIFVHVTDIFSVTNATVGARLSTGGTLTFRNNGQAPDVTAGDAIYSTSLVVPQGVTNLVMTVTARATGKTSVTNVVTYIVTPRPANDDFVNAAKIPPAGGMIIGINKFASMEPGEPYHAGVPTVDDSVWWNWSPASSGSVVLDTAGSSFDTVLAVYTGLSVTTLTPVASVDDVFIPLDDGSSARRLQGYLLLDVEAGATYRITVAGYDSSQAGVVRLRVEPGGLPDTTGPTVFVNSPTNGMVLQTNSITVSGTAYDPTPNASGVAQVQVRLNGEDIGTTATWNPPNWTTRVLLKDGPNSIEAVAIDYAGNLSSPRVLSVDVRHLNPVNDVMLNGLPLTGDAGTVNGDSSRATHEEGEPMHAGNEGAQSIWWYFRPTAGGVLTLDTQGSAFDTLLAVYTGTRITNLVAVNNGSNDDALDGVSYSKVSFGATAGQTYRIAVDGYGGASGAVQLNYSFRPVALYSLTVNATAGGQVSPESGLYEAGSTVPLQALPASGFDFKGWQNASGVMVSTNLTWSVVMTADATYTGVFAAHQFTDDFERGGFNPALSYQFNLASSAGPWTVQTNTAALVGLYAARSAPIGSNQMSRLGLLVNVSAGSASFDYKVSSELGWDYLEFWLNGVRRERWSGEVGWLRYEFPLPAGTNALEWRYVKDASDWSPVGQDAAFLDNLDLPLSGTITAAYLPSGEVRLQLRGQPGKTCVVEASSDLSHWTPISTNTSPNGVIEVVDPTAAGRSARFYRAVDR
jgi:subtilisin family serine protease